MTIDNVFDIGDLVYLKHDPNQDLRQVVSIQVFAEGELMYRLMCGQYQSDHYDFEITKDKRF